MHTDLEQAAIAGISGLNSRHENGNEIFVAFQRRFVSDRGVADEIPAGGRYLIQKAIGHGGAGSVYVAWDQQLGRHVAIKRIREDAAIEASIRKEAGILASLHHPNIVSIYDFASDSEGPFVVMEYVEGQTLDEIAETRPLTTPAFLEMVNQLCRGLSAAHARGLLHLDLKPGNIMLQFHGDNSFTSKILDFGLAKLNHEMTSPEDELVGSPYSIAPEQLDRRPVDQRTDIYSLGCVFYFALSGKNPFEGEDVQAILREHLHGTPRPLSQINTAVPEPLSQALMKMISRDPEERPQSAEEARAALQGVARAPSLRAGTQPTRPGYARKPKTQGSKMGWIVAAVAIFGGGAYLAYQSSQSKPQPPANSDAHEAATPALTPAAGTAVDPLDQKSIAEHRGQRVAVEGQVVSAINSALFRSTHLRFSEDESALVVSIPNEIISLEKAQTFVGKRIHATGTITFGANVNRLVVENEGDLKMAGPK